VDYSDGPVLEASKVAAMLPPLQRVPKRSQDPPPIGATGDAVGYIYGALPALRVPAKPHIESMQGKKLAKLQPRDPSLVETVEL
jgi:hypothetical protein